MARQSSAVTDRGSATESASNEYVAAKGLDVSVKTLRRWRLLGTGPDYIKMGASVRYTSSAVDRFIERCAVKSRVG